MSLNIMNWSPLFIFLFYITFTETTPTNDLDDHVRSALDLQLYITHYRGFGYDGGIRSQPFLRMIPRNTTVEDLIGFAVYCAASDEDVDGPILPRDRSLVKPDVRIIQLPSMYERHKWIFCEVTLITTIGSSNATVGAYLDEPNPPKWAIVAISSGLKSGSTTIDFLDVESNALILQRSALELPVDQPRHLMLLNETLYGISRNERNMHYLWAYNLSELYHWQNVYLKHYPVVTKIASVAIYNRLITDACPDWLGRRIFVAEQVPNDGRTNIAFIDVDLQNHSVMLHSPRNIRRIMFDPLTSRLFHAVYSTVDDEYELLVVQISSLTGIPTVQGNPIKIGCKLSRPDMAMSYDLHLQNLPADIVLEDNHTLSVVNTSSSIQACETRKSSLISNFADEDVGRRSNSCSKDIFLPFGSEGGCLVNLCTHSHTLMNFSSGIAALVPFGKQLQPFPHPKCLQPYKRPPIPNKLTPESSQVRINIYIDKDWIKPGCPKDVSWPVFRVTVDMCKRSTGVCLRETRHLFNIKIRGIPEGEFFHPTMTWNNYYMRNYNKSPPLPTNAKAIAISPDTITIKFELPEQWNEAYNGATSLEYNLTSSALLQKSKDPLFLDNTDLGTIALPCIPRKGVCDYKATNLDSNNRYYFKISTNYKGSNESKEMPHWLVSKTFKDPGQLRLINKTTNSFTFRWTANSLSSEEWPRLVQFQIYKDSQWQPIKEIDVSIDGGQQQCLDAGSSSHSNDDVCIIQVSNLESNRPYEYRIDVHYNDTVYYAGQKTENTSPSDSEGSGTSLSSETLASVITVAFLAVVSSILVICIINLRRKQKRQKEALLEAEALLETPQSCYVGDVAAIVQTYDKTKFEIPPDSVEMSRTISGHYKVLGGGEFGRVLEATLTEDNLETVVAVKEARRPDCMKLLISELLLLQYLRGHPNVVKLIGAVTAQIQKGCLYVVMEKCDHGSLYEYLVGIARNDGFCDELVSHQRNQAYFENCQALTCFTYMLQLDPTWSFRASEERRNRKILTSDLISYCYQIACGMEYIHAKGVIHRDIAARNMLLGCRGQVKVADFGLSNFPVTGSYYVKLNKETKVPWRTMAPESLTSKPPKFTKMSDVYTYGVMMWEIFELGKVPYGDMNDMELVCFLALQNRLPQPRYCSDSIYQIMQECWRDRDWRPCFSDLSQTLLRQLRLSSAELWEEAMDRNGGAITRAEAQQLRLGSGSFAPGPKISDSGSLLEKLVSIKHSVTAQFSKYSTDTSTLSSSEASRLGTLQQNDQSGDPTVATEKHKKGCFNFSKVAGRYARTKVIRTKPANHGICKNEQAQDGANESMCENDSRISMCSMNSRVGELYPERNKQEGSSITDICASAVGALCATTRFSQNEPRCRNGLRARTTAVEMVHRNRSSDNTNDPQTHNNSDSGELGVISSVVCNPLCREPRCSILRIGPQDERSERFEGSSGSSCPGVYVGRDDIDTRLNGQGMLNPGFGQTAALPAYTDQSSQYDELGDTTTIHEANVSDEYDRASNLPFTPAASTTINL